MKTAIFSLLVVAGVAQASVQGFDISNYQGNVNFAGAYSSGARFVMIKVRARNRRRIAVVEFRLEAHSNILGN